MGHLNNLLESENLELLLKQAYDTLSLAVETAGIGSWDWKYDTDEVSYDEQWFSILGFKPHQVVVNNSFWEDRLHPDDRERVLEQLNQHFIGNTPTYKSEHRIQNKNGGYVWVLDVGKVIERDVYKKPKRVTGITIDITEKVLISNKIHESEEKFKSIFDHLNDAYCRFDFSGQLLEVNKNLCQMIGVDEVLLKKSNLKLFFHNKMLKLLNRRLTSIIENESVNFETMVFTQKGKELPISISARLITKNGNGVIQALIRDITERKAYEKALLDEKHRFKALVEHSPNVITRFGKNLRCQYASPNVHKLMGIAADDTIGKRFNEMKFSIGLSKFLEDKLKRVFKKNGIVNINFSIELKGEPKHFEAVLVPELAQTATVESVLMTLSDVTEKVISERDLNYSRHQLEDAEKSVHFGTYEIDLLLSYTKWSQETFTMFEREKNYPPPIMDEFFYTYVHPDDYRMVAEYFQTCIDHGNNINHVYRINTTSGKLKYLQDIARMEINEKTGKPVKIIGSLIDITEKKQIENKLAEEHDILQVIMDNVPDAIYLKDKEGRIVRANKALADLFDISDPGLVIGSTFYDFASKDVADDITETEQTLFLTGDPIINKEYNYMFPVGNIWLSTTLIGVKDSTGKVSQLVGILRNINQYKLTQEQLLKERDRAEAADKLKSAFLANMSHEIRTPINGILGFANLMEMREFSRDKVVRYLRIINSSGKLLLSLINDIIDIAKIEAGQITIEPSLIDLPVLFNELVEFYKGEINRREKDNIQIYINIPPSDSENTILTDPFRLKQIINNLINNALKFTEDGYIEIGYKLENNDIVFFVKDTGIGMAKDESGIIFERFKQAGLSSKKKEGTGLGLAISKGLVELLGGNIWVTSAMGEGSQFYFKLPGNFVSNGSLKLITGVADIPFSDYQWTGKNLLLVEDEEVNYLYINELVGTTGVNLIHVTTGEEAIEICTTTEPIDLILMDMRLPGISGFDATKIVKKIRKNLPIIAQTAYAMENEQRNCMEAGCDHYLTKPFEQKILMKVINDYFFQ